MTRTDCIGVKGPRPKGDCAGEAEAGPRVTLLALAREGLAATDTTRVMVTDYYQGDANDFYNSRGRKG